MRLEIVGSDYLAWVKSIPSWISGTFEIINYLPPTIPTAYASIICVGLFHALGCRTLTTLFMVPSSASIGGHPR